MANSVKCGTMVEKLCLVSVLRCWLLFLVDERKHFSRLKRANYAAGLTPSSNAAWGQPCS
jgi:hypothetical protein